MEALVWLLSDKCLFACRVFAFVSVVDNKAVNVLSAQCDGTLLATGSYDGYARLWSTDGKLSVSSGWRLSVQASPCILPPSPFPIFDSLVGLVVKASASRVTNLSGMLIFCYFLFFSVIFGLIRSPVSSFSFLTFCLFLCSFSVRWHVHVEFQLFSQKSLTCGLISTGAKIFRGRVMPVTEKLALRRLPCQTPGIIGSVLGLVGPVSVYCDSILSLSQCGSTHNCLKLNLWMRLIF